MTLRSQRGQTLVELLVGMTLTALILGALAGLLYTVGIHSRDWEQRVDNSGAGGALVAALQADAHRYPCGIVTGGGGTSLTLHGSPAGGGQTYTYFSFSLPVPDTWQVTRVEGGGSPQTGVVIDRLPARPQFSVTAPTITIKVNGLPTLIVYYAVPKGACP